jgi:hypothetical protein
MFPVGACSCEEYSSTPHFPAELQRRSDIQAFRTTQCGALQLAGQLDILAIYFMRFSSLVKDGSVGVILQARPQQEEFSSNVNLGSRTVLAKWMSAPFSVSASFPYCLVTAFCVLLEHAFRISTMGSVRRAVFRRWVRRHGRPTVCAILQAWLLDHASPSLRYPN